MLSTLRTPSNSQPSLYIDLEGENLSRDGTISLLTLHVLPSQTTYLVDVHNLQNSAFTTAVSATDDQTLKKVLESAEIKKVFFDVRNDSDALFFHYGIALQGNQDLQLMELAARDYNRKFVSGLGKCLASLHLPQREHAECQHVKEEAPKLFAPDKGGSYAVFNERPLQPLIKQYCVQDVVHMPALWQRYNSDMDDFWRDMVEQATEARVQESQSSGYQPHGRHKAHGCWTKADIKDARKRWNRTGAL
ncbi:hypothetical protein BDV95DRAFT_499346 [Massariosphaeria phaeospora]|uniref:3'-5' exonuclease domain-containing protein n=1 Tax=Massariosphaeria phaeospora TaxID=100035 RepID=A0A7C8I789_9PLEO|nr:hypothetical protein BDV95DRAFT_499346 [Massariosphaeria phaeospora]